MPTPRLAIIGGTGFYRLPDLELQDSLDLDTPFGTPSAPIRLGQLAGQPVAFLARHGEQHQFAPHRVNYRANLWALREVGAGRIVAVNAVGGIAPDCPPEAIVIPNQLIDYTWGRVSSFADEAKGEVRHIDFGDPYDAALREELLRAAQAAAVEVVGTGVYGVTQGPRLETRAEIRRLQQDGCTIVGMTSMPEAALARELAIPYACLSVVANWAAGVGEPKEITMEQITTHLGNALARVG
ncbi:MAG: S-methyl-5'-thioinosine phosphorylase [Xanthomonadales bacterium]|nr:S-methyl-5'-thioinosine phosphorylase [Xanthomonadales bacterium]